MEGNPQVAVRILLAEDVAADVELSMRELKRAGMRIEWRVADSKEAFRRALLEFRPQVILSDFTMPQFDGMAALRVARELAPGTPFLFVSGTLGEEYAIRALRNGATDYVLKHRLGRLVPAMQRALKETAERGKRQIAEAALQESEERHRPLFELNPMPMWVYDLETLR